MIYILKVVGGRRMLFVQFLQKSTFVLLWCTIWQGNYCTAYGADGA